MTRISPRLMFALLFLIGLNKNMKPLGTFFFLLAFWLLSLSSFAQKNSILGTIVDEKKQPSLVFPCT